MLLEMLGSELESSARRGLGVEIIFEEIEYSMDFGGEF